MGKTRRLNEKRRRITQAVWSLHLSEEDLDRIIAVIEEAKQRQKKP